MKKTILAAAIALAASAWAQAPEQKAAAATPTEAANPAPKAKVAKSPRKATASARRHMDARHCLHHPNNAATIRCAEEFLWAPAAPAGSRPRTATPRPRAVLEDPFFPAAPAGSSGPRAAARARC